MLETQLLSTCTLVEVPADVTLIEEGEDANAFYFIYHGRVVAFQQGCTEIQETGKEDDDEQKKEHVHLGVLGPGSYFGEISILTETKCRASIVTVSRCMLLRVSKENFRDRWCTIPQFRSEFLMRIFGKACKLEHVLSHTLAKSAFYAFLKTELATENLDFVNAVVEFQTKHEERTNEENLDAGLNIVKDFLKEDSDRQVNVPQGMMAMCVSQIDAISSKIEPARRVLPFNLFDKLKQEISSITLLPTKQPALTDNKPKRAEGGLVGQPTPNPEKRMARA